MNQVGALKQMVDEFRDYARLPTAKIGPVNLGEVVQEVLSLYPDGLEGIAINQQIDWAVPNILGDSIQLRQIIHNLVKNAAEAVEGFAHPRIEILIEAIRNETRKSDQSAILSQLGKPNLPTTDRRANDVTGVRLTVRDNGPGFAPKLAGRAFEPYVTTKSKGTGLGLAIVKKIVDDHGALIDLGKSSDAQSGGAQVGILFTRLQDKRAGADKKTA